MDYSTLPSLLLGKGNKITDGFPLIAGGNDRGMSFNVLVSYFLVTSSYTEQRDQTFAFTPFISGNRANLNRINPFMG